MKNYWLDRKANKASEPLVFKRKYRWDFSDIAEKPSDEAPSDDVLPPWNTENYNGWECDL